MEFHTISEEKNFYRQCIKIQIINFINVIYNFFIEKLNKKD